MNLTLLPQEALTELQQATFTYLRELLREERSKPAFGWVSNKAATKLLDASPRTLQNWRDTGVLGFTQIKGKIYYSHEDLDQMLREHYRKPFKGQA